MSTIFDIRKLRLPGLSRGATVIAALAVVLALVGVFVGGDIYRQLVNTTVVAYFPEANALYPGDRVQIMGYTVGAVDKIEPGGDKVKVTLHYANKYKVPADASAVIVNPSLIASRTIVLTPAYKGGPVLRNNAVIPIERTQVPAEWDSLRNSFAGILDHLGPTPEQAQGPFGDAIESLADGLAGKGKEINGALDSLSKFMTTLGESRGDIFAVLRSLSMFVNALHRDDQRFVSLNTNLAVFTNGFASSSRELAGAIQNTDELMRTARKFFSENREVLARDFRGVADYTTTLDQPDNFDHLETLGHVIGNTATNLVNIYEPAHGALTALLALPYFANPMQWICGASIQAGSRAGYQDSAELCAEYLAPVMDAIKMNYLPFGFNPFTTADTLPKHVAYSDPRLRPPGGYKDTTVPGIWVPDTPLSHRNTQHGWIVAPGMQGVKVDHITQGLLTPESLAELMGGPDIAPIQSQYQTPPGPPNAYDQYMAAPVIGMPIPWPGPPPPPAPAPGPVPVGPPLPAESPMPLGAGQ